MPLPTSVVWQSAARPANPVRWWDGDCVVYNGLSGDTHVLDVVTGEVLRSVMNGPLRTDEIGRRLAGFLEVPADDRIADTVGKILHHLDELGLIEPVGGC